MRHLCKLWLAGGLIFARLVAEPQASTPKAMNQLAVAAFQSGDFSGAVRLLRSALSAEQLTPDPLIRASLCLNLAAIQRSRANYPEAASLYRESMLLRTNTLGQNHPLLAGPQRGLALCLLAQGRPQEAEQLARAAAALPLDPAEAAATRNDLAKILIGASAFDDAEAAALDAQHLLQSANAVNTIGYADVLSTLGVITRNRDRLPAALRYSAAAAALMEELAGPANPSTAAAWNNLAQVLVLAGKPSKAQPLLERAISCWEHAYGPSHPDVASGINNLASLFQGERRYRDAERLFQRALEINQNVYGSNSAQAALALNNLASLAEMRHHYAEAVPLFVRALAIHENAFGMDHPATGLIAGNLASVYYKKKRYSEAEPLFAKASRIREQTFGRYDPLLAHLLDCYAQVLRFNQNFSEAASIEAHASGIRVHNALRLQN